MNKESIVLGSGDLYCTEFEGTDKELPTNEVLETVSLSLAKAMVNPAWLFPTIVTLTSPSTGSLCTKWRTYFFPMYLAPIQDEECFQTAYEVKGLLTKTKGAKRA